MRHIRVFVVVLIILAGTLAFADRAVRETMGLSARDGLFATGLVKVPRGMPPRTALYASLLGHSSQFTLPRRPSLTGARAWGLGVWRILLRLGRT